MESMAAHEERAYGSVYRWVHEQSAKLETEESIELVRKGVRRLSHRCACPLSGAGDWGDGAVRGVGGDGRGEDLGGWSEPADAKGGLMQRGR